MRPVPHPPMRRPIRRPIRRPGRRPIAPVLLAAALALAGCGEDGLVGGLRQAGIATTPDEFMVLPTRPLQMPPDLAALPPPVPGQTDRVAYRPREDAIAALSARPPAPGAGAPAASLVARAGPADPGIRAVLAEEDALWRRQNRPRVFERWFNRNPAALVYSGMALDADAEAERLRARGVRTPAAPPRPE